MEIHVAVAGSVLVGSALLGVVGALLALPFAATMQAFISGSDSTSRWKRTPSTRAPRGVGGVLPDPVTRA